MYAQCLRPSIRGEESHPARGVPAFTKYGGSREENSIKPVIPGVSRTVPRDEWHYVSVSLNGGLQIPGALWFNPAFSWYIGAMPRMTSTPLHSWEQQCLQIQI